MKSLIGPMRPAMEIGRNIGIKKGTWYFSFFAFFFVQNTHTSDTTRPVRPEILSSIAKG